MGSDSTRKPPQAASQYLIPGKLQPTPGILMQREDVILELIFLPCKANKKLKTYIEKISDLIHKGYWKYPSSRWYHKALDIQMSTAERNNILVPIYT
ncbi:hypothetical protein STEG23_009543, partial [Scotinomys teguina]